MRGSKIVIWGAGGHARVVADVIHCLKQSEIAGFLDDANPERRGSEFCGGRILGGAEQLAPLLKEGIGYIVIAIGDCVARLRSASIARDAGFHLATLCHPSAVVATSASIGPGTVLFAGSVVNPDCCIGANVILNTAATVDHECLVEDGVHIGPGAHIGGRCRIGSSAWIGIGATVKDGVDIAPESTIGAGAVVVRDIPQNVIAYGVPARVIRNRVE